MSVHRRVTKVGGSLGVIIPRDVAEVIGVNEGSEICLHIVGRQLVIEPEDDKMSEKSFQRAFAAVLRKHDSAFRDLAEYDRTGLMPVRE